MIQLTAEGGALAFAMLIQFGVTIWWASAMHTRMGTLEKVVEGMPKRFHDINGLIQPIQSNVELHETLLERLDSDIKELKVALDKLTDKIDEALRERRHALPYST